MTDPLTALAGGLLAPPCQTMRIGILMTGSDPLHGASLLGGAFVFLCDSGELRRLHSLQDFDRFPEPAQLSSFRAGQLPALRALKQDLVASVQDPDRGQAVAVAGARFDRAEALGFERRIRLVLHAVTIRAFRLRDRPENLGCDRLRGVGFRAECSCGARLPVRASWALARIDLALHRDGTQTRSGSPMRAIRRD